LGQALPQRPQLRLSLLRLRQRSPQSVSPAPHTTPQAPQWRGSYWVASQRAAAPDPQSVSSVDGHRQAPWTHSVPPMHDTPQAPQ